jgi:hypothetical protein
MRNILLSPIVLLGFSYGAQSEPDEVQVYQCVSASGHVSYQDQPCPPAAEATLRRLPRPDDPPASAAEEDPRPVPDTDPEPTIPPQSERGERPPEPPSLWICVDAEGAERESVDGIPEGRYVPLWVVGRDPYVPAQTFGRVGQPRPRPRVQPSDGPSTTQAPRAAQNTLIYVEERCRRLPAGRVCERYSNLLRELQRTMFNSQASDRAELKPESDRLKRYLADYCGRR